MTLLKIESYKKGIVISTLLNIVAKGTQFLNTLIVAYFFGVNVTTDLYFCVISVATMVCGAINGIDLLVLVPEGMRLREQKSESNSREFFNFFIFVYASIGILISIIILANPVFFFSLFSKFPKSQLIDNSRILYVSSILVFFQLLNNLLNAILTSYKYFTISILTNLFNSIFTIIFTTFFYRYIGIFGTILGVAFGNFINFILLIGVLKHNLKWQFSKVLFLRDKRVWKNIALMQINILPVWFRNYIVIYIISGMNKGSLTSINFAQTIAALPEVFILTQVASVAGIKFSELAGKRDYLETSKILNQLLTILFILIIPIAITMSVCYKEIIKIVFERGNFDSSATSITSLCFFYFSLLLPTKVFDILFTRLFTAYQVYGVSTIFAFIGHTIITILIYLGLLYFQIRGYFIALIFGYSIVMPIIYYIVLRISFKEMKIKLILKIFMKFFLLMIFVFTLSYLVKQYLFFSPIIDLIFISVFSSVLMCISSYFFIDITYISDTFVGIFVKFKNKYIL